MKQQLKAMLKATATVITGCLLLCGAPATHAITLDFASIPGGQVQFVGTGNTFSFLPASGSQFQITASSGFGDAVGLLGRMDGTFTIGSITTVGPMQTAPVSGVGQLVVSDGINDLTGTLVWDSIGTLGTGGIMNINGMINLSALTYAGLNSDLAALAISGAGTQIVSFQFIPSKTLTDLTRNGKVHSTSFSGTLNSVAVPDAGASAMLLGMALIGLGLFGRKRNAC